MFLHFFRIVVSMRVREPTLISLNATLNYYYNNYYNYNYYYYNYYNLR